MESQKIIIPDAKTLDGVNIHLSNIATTLQDLKIGQRDTNAKLENMQASFVTLAVFADHLKKDDEHEVRIREGEKFQNTIAGRIWGISAVVGLVSTVAGFIIELYLNNHK